SQHVGRRSTVIAAFVVGVDFATAISVHEPSDACYNAVSGPQTVRVPPFQLHGWFVTKPRWALAPQTTSHDAAPQYVNRNRGGCRGGCRGGLPMWGGNYTTVRLREGISR